MGWKFNQSAVDELIYERKVALDSCEKLSKVKIPEKFRCAEINGKFDIGSAVMCRVNNTEMSYQQVGIVNRNLHGKSLAILIDVTEFKHQIDEEFKELKINTESYTFSLLNSRGFFTEIGKYLDAKILSYVRKIASDNDSIASPYLNMIAKYFLEDLNLKDSDKVE